MRGGAAPPTPVAGTKASLGAVNGTSVDSSGNVYFSSSLGCVFKLDTTGMATRYAGTCRPGYSGDGGTAPRFRRIDAVTGVITTVAGNGKRGGAGDGGPALAAELNSPVGVAKIPPGTCTSRIAATTVPKSLHNITVPQDADGDSQINVRRCADAAGALLNHTTIGLLGRTSHEIGPNWLGTSAD
jgi:hypothetical protein